MDNKAIIVPNAKLTGDNITNYTMKEKRRVDLVFGVNYGEEIEKVKRVIADVLGSDARILIDPPPTVAVLGIEGGGVNFAVRPWVRTDDYWDVFFNTNENMKKRFDAEGIRSRYLGGMCTCTRPRWRSFNRLPKRGCRDLLPRQPLVFLTIRVQSARPGPFPGCPPGACYAPSYGVKRLSLTNGRRVPSIHSHIKITHSVDLGRFP